MRELKQQFEIRDYGKCTSLLGMKVDDTGRGKNRRVQLSMPGYVKELLAGTGMIDANGVRTPAESGLKMSRNDPEAESTLVNGVEYRSCCGAMLWMSLTCMPHLAHTVNLLCRHVNRPTPAAIAAMKRLLRFLARDHHQGLTYTAGGNAEMQTYTDSDWGDCPGTGRSTTGYCIMLAGAAIDWKSKLQPTVAMSTVEAEAMALCAGVQETDYLRGLRLELHPNWTKLKPTEMFVDNKGCRDDCYNRTGRRTRHINLRFHRVREAVAQNSVVVHRVTGGNDAATSKMIADILTKALPGPLYKVMAAAICGTPCH